jgi:hypothetical protein
VPSFRYRNTRKQGREAAIPSGASGIVGVPTFFIEMGLCLFVFPANPLFTSV